MRQAEQVTSKINFFDLTSREQDEMVMSFGWPKFRADQLREWVYKKLAIDAEQMTNLSKADRATLAQHVSFSSATITRQQHSSDGTIKLLLAWDSIQSAETVMIPDGDRFTACVSSQVGCPVGCTFCASGINGVKGNLSAAQIVEQVFQLNRLLAQEGERISNVVFMGMGEPLANYAAVMAAVRVLHEPLGFNIGARKITISTVGIPARI